jgi:D-glycerate 3-kinase
MSHCNPDRNPASDSIDLVELLLSNQIDNQILDNQISNQNRQLLAADLLASWQVEAFQITADSVNGVIEQRLSQMRQIYPDLEEFCRRQLGRPCSISVLWQLWLPLANQLFDWQQSLNRPLVQGILGGQGTGKTTLTRILTKILHHFGLQVCSLSIDDLYKTYAERQKLQQVDPRFRWRGPPGTHDVERGLTVLDQLRRAEPAVAIPRFDKSLHNGAGDQITPELIAGADVILFEGWFVGAQPVDPQVFAAAPPPINTDVDRAFAREVNRRLQEYLPLWDRLDRLMVLYPSDYRLSQQWRRQAEQQMIAAGKSGMSDAETNQFVEYFWQALHPDLFIKPLLTNTEQVDLVIEIDANHQPIQIYCPRRQSL